MASPAHRGSSAANDLMWGAPGEVPPRRREMALLTSGLCRCCNPQATSIGWQPVAVAVPPRVEERRWSHALHLAALAPVLVAPGARVPTAEDRPHMVERRACVAPEQLAHDAGRFEADVRQPPEVVAARSGRGLLLPRGLLIPVGMGLRSIPIVVGRHPRGAKEVPRT
jgi:hypothetical protein